MFSFQSGGKGTFAEVLQEAIPGASEIRIAVAWTRVSGLDLIWEELNGALNDGAALTLVTGIDAGNTSSEALRALVDLQASHQKAKCLVRHQEGPSLFHTKLYAFDGGDKWSIYAGSSNLTAAGLHSNEELMVRVEALPGTSELTSFASAWKAIAEGHANFVKPLTAEFCDELIARGYSIPEASSNSSDQRRSDALKRKEPLFGTKNPGRPPFRGSVPLEGDDTGKAKAAKGLKAKASGQPEPETVLEMHEGTSIPNDWSRISILLLRSRGTQSQLPKAVFEAIKRKLGHTDMLESCEVRDRSSGGSRRISPVGEGNTYKLETGLAEDVDLVAKFEAYDAGVQVEFFDASQGEGKRIFDYLKAGEGLEPPQTVNVKPSAENATLYRVD